MWTRAERDEVSLQRADAIRPWTKTLRGGKVIAEGEGDQLPSFSGEKPLCSGTCVTCRDLFFNQVSRIYLLLVADFQQACAPKSNGSWICANRHVCFLCLLCFTLSPRGSATGSPFSHPTHRIIPSRILVDTDIDEMRLFLTQLLLIHPHLSISLYDCRHAEPIFHVRQVC